MPRFFDSVLADLLPQKIHEIRDFLLPVGLAVSAAGLAVEAGESSFSVQEFFHLPVGVGEELAVSGIRIGPTFLFTPGEVDAGIGIDVAVVNVVHEGLHDHKDGGGDAGCFGEDIIVFGDGGPLLRDRCGTFCR